MTQGGLVGSGKQLTSIQRQAADWGEGPLLVLAGPGSGKTEVLTCRIAQLLNSSREKKFRVLALTFTNKAADEMKRRVANLVPGLEDRTYIGTFHGFCAQVLRQHGVHLGINPDFSIYSSDLDRKAILEDALMRGHSEGYLPKPEDVKFLTLIDQLKSKLIQPADAELALARLIEKKQAAAAYLMYEQELRRLNALDFNSLIFEAFRLVDAFPAIAERYRRTYTHWLLDEFQDTNKAQYKFLRTLAGDTFRNIFAVADDDQIIYEWNGANFKQIQSFISDFAAQVIQLPTNYRCPAAIVEAANRLVVYNAQRTSSKKPLIAGKTEVRFPPSEHIQLRVYESGEEEAAGIAKEIAERGAGQWAQTAVLGRTKHILNSVSTALRELKIPCVVAQRRDDFLSPEVRWLVGLLRQIVRPLDRRNLTALVEAFNRMSKYAVSVDQVITDSETTGRDYLAIWVDTVRRQILEPPMGDLVDIVSGLIREPSGVRAATDAIIKEFTKKLTAPEPDSDLVDDMAAWQELCRDISGHIGKNAPLDQFLQELQLRSKEPPQKPETVTLMTIHAAKGREFDFVYVLGLAEGVMPSFQSKQKGDRSPQMEEERRNCFVAITRTKECLILSRAESYRGWRKEPSRFLVEMGLVKNEAA